MSESAIKAWPAEAWLNEAGTVGARVFTLRAKVLEAGLRPVAVEASPRSAVLGGCFAGMVVRDRDAPGLTVLGLPRRKIGRYEVVCPTRFEEPSTPHPQR